MFEKIKEVFSKPTTKLYYIEIDDVAINKQMSNIIIQLEGRIKEFKAHINNTTMTIKEQDLQEIHQMMIKVKEEVDMIEHDVKKITDVEFKNKDYLVIKDKTFLEDKKIELETINREINKFINIIENNPSAKSLQTEFLPKLVNQFNTIIECTNKVIKDDDTLRIIYKKLTEI